MKLSDIIFNEEPASRQKTVDLDSLTWDLLVSMFGQAPSFGFQLPNPDDSSRIASREADLDDWKEGIKKRFGNVNVRIDTEAKYAFDKIKILDDEFNARKRGYINSKASWLDKERSAGRTSGLD